MEIYSLHQSRLGRLIVTLICLFSLLHMTPPQQAEAATKTCTSAGYKCVVIKAKFNVASGDSIVGTASKLTGFTFLVTNKNGQVLLRKKFTSHPTTTLSLRTAPIRLVGGKIPAGISFHLINKDGTYYGPIVTSWSGTQRTKATTVSTSMNRLATNQATINLNTVTFKTKSSRQGYGYTSKKTTLAATPTTVATAGIPKGVGTYGRQSNSVRTKRAALTITASEMVDGADADKDGIINAFDVNDDGANGDSVPDYQDTSMPTPSTGPATCEAAASFTIFSNFKATHEDFIGTINAHSSVATHEATPANIERELGSTLTYAIQPITSVCGSTVVKTEFMGVSVPYAPSSYQTLCDNNSGTIAPECSTVSPDWQWKPSTGDVTAGSGTPFTIATGSAFACTTSKCNINALDVFMQRITTANGNVYEYTTSPTFVFVTHPMLKEYKVISNSTTCIADSSAYTTIDYAGTPAGSTTSPINIASAANEIVCVRIHRPQRFAFFGESGWSAGDLYDIGKLDYYPDIPNAIGGGPGGPGRCDAMLQSDGKADTKSSVAAAGIDFYTLSWDTNDLKTCFTSKSASWTSGALDIDIQVVAPVQNSGNAAQKIFFTVTP